MKIQQGTAAFWKTNVALFAAGFVTFINVYTVQTLFPQFSETYHISPATASLALSVATLTLAFSLIIFGSLSEAWGRKPLMVASLISTSLITILLAFMPTFESLLALRVLQGIAFAGVPSIAMAYLAEEMDAKSLGVAMGLYISGNSIGGLSGRLLMGILVDVSSWQVGMIVIGILSLAVTAYFIWALKPSMHFVAKPLRLRTLWHSLLSHMRTPLLAALFGIGFCLMGGFVALFNYIGFKLLEPPYSLSTSVIGALFIVYLVGTFSSTWFGSLSLTYGRQRMLLIGFTIMLSGALMTLAVPLLFKLIGLVFFTFGFFAAHSIASNAVSTYAAHDKAQASSLYLFAYYIGSSIGGTAAGFFWMHFHWNGIVLFVTLFLMIGLLLTCCLKKLQPSFQ